MHRYALDPGRSRIRAVTRTSVHPVIVDTDGLEGFLAGVATDSGWRLNAAEISLAMADVRTGNPLYDRELGRRLETSKHPRATGLVSEPVLLSSEARSAQAQLRFHGVEQSVSGDLRLLEPPGDRLLISGHLRIDMRAFGLPPPRVFMLRVEPYISIEGRVEAHRT